jgi:benzoate membrane transport protein
MEKSPSALEVGTTNVPVFQAIRENVVDIKKSASWSALLAGFLAVLISVTGPVAILFQAAQAGHLSEAQTNSWLWTIFLGSGLFGLVLTLRYRMPIIGAWGSATTALLVDSLATHPFHEVVGAFFVASLAVTALGLSGLFSKFIHLVPRPVVMAMLGGVLFNFGVTAFSSVRSGPWIALPMIIIFFAGRAFKFRATIVFALLAGLAVAGIQHKLVNPHIHANLVHPIWTNPTFTVASAINLALPIFLLVMTTQFATGSAVLLNMNYEAPVNAIVTVGGVLSLLSAGFGGSGVNCAAMTAAIGCGPDADPNPKTRYFAGVTSGFVYIALGLYAGVETGFLNTLPTVLLAVLAGLALIPTISSAINEALVDAEYRDAGIAALLISVSGIKFFSIAAPFWALVGGILIHQFTLWGNRKKKS